MKMVKELPALFFLFLLDLSSADPVDQRPEIRISFKINTTQVYAPRLDDPSSRTFERCSTDTFNITGPCLYKICYLYLLQQGSDGWKPEWVKVTPLRTRTITFNYNTFLPNGVWYESITAMPLVHFQSDASPDSIVLGNCFVVVE